MASRGGHSVGSVKNRTEVLGLRFNPTSTVTSFLNSGRVKGATIVRQSAGYYEIKLTKPVRSIESVQASMSQGDGPGNQSIQTWAAVSGVRSSTGSTTSVDTIGVFAGYPVATSGVLTTALADFSDTDIVVNVSMINSNDWTS